MITWIYTKYYCFFKHKYGVRARKMGLILGSLKISRRNPCSPFFSVSYSIVIALSLLIFMCPLIFYRPPCRCRSFSRPFNQSISWRVIRWLEVTATSMVVWVGHEWHRWLTAGACVVSQPPPSSTSYPLERRLRHADHQHAGGYRHTAFAKRNAPFLRKMSPWEPILKSC